MTSPVPRAFDLTPTSVSALSIVLSPKSTIAISVKIDVEIIMNVMNRTSTFSISGHEENSRILRMQSSVGMAATHTHSMSGTSSSMEGLPCSVEVLAPFIFHVEYPHRRQHQHQSYIHHKGQSSEFVMEFRSHEAFEAALRRYGHPAAVADLNALKRGGSSWLKFLEALGTSCRDDIIQWSVENKSKSNQSQPVADKQCPAFLAFVDMGEKMGRGYGPRYAEILTEDIRKMMIDRLGIYGRPVAPKMQALYEHEMMVRYHYERAKQEEKVKGDNVAKWRNSSSSVKKQDGGRIDWSGLEKIQIKDIKLYESSAGKYLEGTLLVDPFTPMVGTTTFLEDSNGDVILLALYNFLPDGLYGEAAVPIASQKIPKGGKIKIAAPFMKIFRDGSRGIRIDNPNDIIVSSGNENAVTDEGPALLQAKKLGNDFVAKKLYNVATDAYIGGLRKANLVPTLLSNRSQVYAMLGEWESSLADAAASLVIRPDNKKTWARYKKAREAIENAQRNDFDVMKRSSSVVRTVLLDEAGDVKQLDTSGIKDASKLKDEGNKAFQSKKYADALSFYTASLEVCGEGSRALLSNWSLCCLHTNSYLDAIATASASIRIQPEGKALVRLCRALLTIGEPELCRSLSAKYSAIMEDDPAIKKENNAVLECSAAAIAFFKDPERKQVILISLKYLSQWVGCIETYDAGSKGRGVRAKNDIQAGQVVLIESPIASAHSAGFGKDDNFIINTGSAKVNDSSQEHIKSDILIRSQRDGILSRIVDCLYDGVNTRSITTMQNLMPNLEMCPPLLPACHEYLSTEKVNLTAERVASILNINSHGSNGSFSSQKSFMGSNHTELYPALSMFNHSSTPTCTLIDNKNGFAVVAMKSKVKAGDELTMSYGQDEEKVRRNWGF
eukprot:scaffold248346_cov46-Cyclotella_meneghiniana.AAC.1